MGRRKKMVEEKPVEYVRPPTDKQVDFATTIAEMIGADLPEEFSVEAYHEFISENVDEFYKVQNEIRRELYYSQDKLFAMQHSFVLEDGFCGDSSLPINPGTR